MKRSVLILLGLLVAPVCLAQHDAFVAEMEAVLAREDTASTYLSVLTAVHDLEELAVKYPDEWLAAYWAAFDYTQAGLFSGQDERLKPYVELAQIYYDKAWAAHPNKSKREESDFYILQALIYSFQSGVPADEAEQQKYRDLNRAFMGKAYDTYADNPRFWTMKGIGLLRNEATRKEGRQMLAKADELHARPLESSIHPNWARQWGGFWLARYEDEGE